MDRRYSPDMDRRCSPDMEGVAPLTWLTKCSPAKAPTWPQTFPKPLRMVYPEVSTSPKLLPSSQAGTQCSAYTEPVQPHTILQTLPTQLFTSGIYPSVAMRALQLLPHPGTELSFPS